MPFSSPIFIPTVIRAEGSQNLTGAFVGKYNVFENTAAMDLTLLGTTTSAGNAEIIIRNFYTSTDAITIVQGAGIADIDVSGDLGLVIPPGGIGELKRLGSLNIWSFYGFIEA